MKREASGASTTQSSSSSHCTEMIIIIFKKYQKRISRKRNDQVFPSHSLLRTWSESGEKRKQVVEKKHKRSVIVPAEKEPGDAFWNNKKKENFSFHLCCPLSLLHLATGPIPNGGTSIGTLLIFTRRNHFVFLQFLFRRSSFLDFEVFSILGIATGRPT